MRQIGRPRRAVGNLGVGTVAAALVATSLLGPAGPAAADEPTPAAEPVTVLANDFEDTYAPWGPRGGVTLALTAAEAHRGAGSLSVTGRTADWQGVAVGAAGLLEPGATYAFSAWVKLPAGTAGATGMHLTAEQVPADGGATTYTWIGSSVTVTADAWVEIGGAYTYPEGLSAATIYVEAAPIDGAHPSFLVDDLRVTGPPAAPDVTAVSAVDFEDGTTGDWTQSGGPSLEVRDLPEGGRALAIVGRATSWDGLQSPAGIFAPGTTYTFSMRARLDEGTAGSPGVRFVMKPDYTWIGDAAVTADAWTTVTGTWTAPEGADPATLQVYLGSDDLDAPYTLLVDDLLVTAPSGDGPPDGFVPGGAIDPTTTPVAAAQGTGDVAALTFDDGPNPGTTPQLLDVLAAHHVKAVFCVIGQNVQTDAGAALLRRIVAEGHVLCNHSTSYDDLGSATPAQARAAMLANLEIIRTALGDPFATVPFWRAPNGSWGATPAVAVELGMQPLAVVNTISDWETQDVATLTANLRAAMRPGEIVLAHDGGGDRSGTLAAVETVVAERLAAGWSFTFPVGTPPSAGDVLVSDFEDGTLQGWTARDTGATSHAVAVTDADAHGGAYAAAVTGRDSQGDGLQRDVSALLLPGATYAFEAWVRFPAGQEPGAMTLSAHVDAGANPYPNLVQIDAPPADTWTKVGGTFTMPAFDAAAEIYLETRWVSETDPGNTSSFLVDDVRLSVPEPATVQDLTPLKDTVGFPVGAAVDSRETTGSRAQLLLRHFDQVTPENHMKPEAWYDADRTFRIDPEAAALMDFAVANDLRVYGHVLVWHSQVPDWFFQDDSGAPLPADATGRAVLTQRLHDHVDGVARALSAYGAFGGGNPVVAFDVVNEVVSDATGDPGGMRQSEWYRILGEDYVDLAFRYADEAFNHTYAAPGADRPVALFINDYNTEQTAKQDRYHDLVARLLARGVPVDGVGHQFHVSVTTPVSSLDAALTRFADLPVAQAVTELDVTVPTPVTAAKLVDQGYYYRDVVDVLRGHDLFSATVWGLTDDRSWRSESAPVIFDGGLQAKPAYYGIAAPDELPAQVRSAFVFGGDVPLDDGAFDAVAWRELPPVPLSGEAGSFGLRWSDDHLTVLADVTAPGADAVEIQLGDQVVRFGRDGSSDTAGVTGLVRDEGTAWRAVVHVPAAPAEGGTAQLDLRVLAGPAVVGGWNSPGALGTVSFVEPLSSVDVVEAATDPVVDGAVDDVWAAADAVRTDKTVEGAADGATADVRTLWRGGTLYVLYEVTDPVVDVTSGNPWEQDSVELFVDAGNAKAGAYRAQDAQLRVSADGVASFGTGDAAQQAARLTSATARTATGYVVELAVDLLGQGGLDTFQGLDFQVNDGSPREGQTTGARTAVHTWAEPTGTGYQTTARWGVGHLVAAPVVEPRPPLGRDELTDANRGGVDLPAVVRQPATLTVPLGRAHAGERTEVWLYSEPVLVPTQPATRKGVLTVALPADVTGEHALAVFGDDGALIGWDTLVVLAAGDPAVNLAPPAVTGKPAVGTTLRATPGTWAPDAGLRYAYRWQRDGVDLRGATGATYTVQRADAGHRLTVVVTASARGIAPASATSRPVTVPQETRPGHGGPGHGGWGPGGWGPGGWDCAPWSPRPPWSPPHGWGVAASHAWGLGAPGGWGLGAPGGGLPVAAHRR